MKNLLFFLAGLLLIIWVIIVWGYDYGNSVHILPVIAAFLITIKVVFKKQLLK